VTFRKYLVLAGVALFAAAGDSMLARGMKQVGSIAPHHLSQILLTVLNPTVAAGILLLLCFFACYMNALSWADLTYVMPATSVSYIMLTLIARFLLHESVSVTRWAGVLLISAGVGFVTQGPALTHRTHPQEREQMTLASGVEQ